MFDLREDIKGIVDNLIPRFTNIIQEAYSYGHNPYVCINSINIDSLDRSCDFVDMTILYGFDEPELCKTFELSVPTNELSNIEFVCGCFYMKMLWEENITDVVY